MSAPRQPPKFSLPTHPSLEHLRKQAKQRLVKLRAGGAGVQLAEAQLLVAREYGFSSWRLLKAAVEENGRPAPYSRPPLNQHRSALSLKARWAGLAAESTFFNSVALAMFLACVALTVNIGGHRIAHNPAPVTVEVEILH